MNTTDTDDKTVYVTTVNDGGRYVYHTNKHCDRLGESTRPRQRDTLRDEYTECAYCANSREWPDSDDKECPYCGAAVGHLARHLPGCSET